MSESHFDKYEHYNYDQVSYLSRSDNDTDDEYV